MKYSKAKMVIVAIISVIAFEFSIYFGIDYSKKLSVSTEPRKEVEKEYSVSRVGLYKVVGLKVKRGVRDGIRISSRSIRSKKERL